MFAEDMSVFFDTQNGFAVEATIAGISFSAIYDSAYYDAGGVATKIEMLILPDESLPAGAVVGVPITIGAPINKTLTLRKPEPDNNGLTTLILE